MDAVAKSLCWVGYGEGQSSTAGPPATGVGDGSGTPGGRRRAGESEAAAGQLSPELLL